MYDFTAPLVAFFVLAGVSSTVAVAVLARAALDLRAARTRVVVPIELGRPASTRQAA